jgi:hypothetical protein
MTDMLDRARFKDVERSPGAATYGYDLRIASSPNTLPEWLSANPVDRRRFTATLAAVARADAGPDRFHASVRDFLDEFALRPDDRSRAAAISEEPPPTGDLRHDAFLGALAEHLATIGHLPRPPWSLAPRRFLDSFWFVSETPGFRALAIAQAPAAFRRRGVFIPARSLRRV